MKPYVAFLTAVLAATACSLKQLQFAPEQVITHFATTASVQDIADAAVISLRSLGFTAWKVPTRGRVIVHGWYQRSVSHPSSGFRSWGPVVGGGEGYRYGERTALAVWCVKRYFEITALALGDSTLVTIQPRRWGCNRETLLGRQEVQLTRRLTERIKKVVNAETHY